MTSPLASLSLFKATPRQKLETRHRTHAAWGRGLSLEDYLERDPLLDGYEHGRDKLTTWILAPRNDPETLDFKCACETYKRSGALIHAVAAGPVEPVPCYIVGQVYTPPENRGQGYAKHMLSLLHWVIADLSAMPRDFPSAEWGEPPRREECVGDGVFSGLWSDVGAEFYDKAGPYSDIPGWRSFPHVSTKWAAPFTHEGPELKELQDQSLGEWKWLEEEELQALWQADAIQMRKECEAEASSTHAVVSFLPDGGVAAYKYRRVQFFQRKNKAYPDHWGVMLLPQSNNFSSSLADIRSKTFATWTLDINTTVVVKTLIITRLRATPETFKPLMGQVFEAAQRCGAKVVEIWSLPDEFMPETTNLGGITAARKDNIPGLIYYGNEGKSVNWAFNQKFANC